MHSFVMVIRSVYFGAKMRRTYAKSVGVNRSAIIAQLTAKAVFLSYFLLL